VASDDFDAYMAFCKEEFKFEFCGVDDSVKAFRVPISQKYVEAQFSSQYSGNALRKTLYNHLVEFESATTNRQDYLSALSNLVADVEFVFRHKDDDPCILSNFRHFIEMLEYSIARINESGGEMHVAPQDIGRLLPAKLFTSRNSTARRYATMRNLLMIGGHICEYKRATGRIPSSIADMKISDASSVRTNDVVYIRQDGDWQLLASVSRTKVNVKVIEFDKYVPLIGGRMVRFWRPDCWISMSSNFSKKRKDLYRGATLNEGTPWACRMDGGVVVPCK